MSDGDNATPGDPTTAGPGDHYRVTRNPPHVSPAAPWERAATPARPAADPDRSGSHTEGLSVADLIAKLGGTTPTVPPARHHSAAEPAARDNSQDRTEPIPVVRGVADEIPNLAAITGRRAPLVARRDPEPDDRVSPKRVGRPKAGKPAEPKRKKRRPIILAGRSAAVLFAVSALALTGGAYQWQASKNDLLRNVAALDPNSRDILDPNAQFGDENFLIVGVDSRIGANSEVGAGDTTDAEGSRSDTVMLVNIPANRKRVVAVSFPRDLAITPMSCEAWDPETGDYGPVYDKHTGEWSDQWRYTETKLNSAYSLGGPKCLVKAIQKISGLSINRFMAVDFNGFAKMVDALGGVDVCSTTPLEDYELGTVLATAGHQRLDGHSALNYVRARQVTTEGNGDYGRIKRQQLFLSSLLRSVISTDTLFSLNKLNDVVNMFVGDTYVDNVKTKDLVDLGQSLQGVAAGRITFVTVPTTGVTDADGNEEPRSEDIRALFDAIINDDPLPGENDKNATTGQVAQADKTSEAIAEAATPSSTAPAVPDSPDTKVTELINAVTTDPKDVTVQVSNSTADSGVANTASTQLAEHGFHVLNPDDYSDTVTTTTVLFSAGNEQAAATVAAAFPNAQIERVTGLGEVVQVVLGPDFTAVNAPPASGSAVKVPVTHTGSSTPTQLPEDLTVTNAADVTCE